MSDKNFISYDDAAEVLGTFAERIKDDEYENITYEQWLAKTDEQKEAGNFLVSGVPNADGKVMINGCITLWTNPDRTVEFHAQTVNLSRPRTDFDFIVIEFARDAETTTRFDSVMVAGGRPYTILHWLETTSSSSAEYHRYADMVSDVSKITFGSEVFTNNDTKCIPLKVYGIKLNHQLEIQAIARDVSTSADKCMLSDGETSVEDVMPENVGLENLLTSADQLKTRFSSISGSSTYESTYMVTTSAFNGYIKTAWDALGTGTSGVKVISIGGPACGMLYYKHSDAVGGACILFGYTLTKPIYCNIGANGVVHNSYYL